MMEEMHSIVSLGGGAMTKINLPDGRLERFHNPKFPQQYLERIDDVWLRRTRRSACCEARKGNLWTLYFPM